MKKSELEQKVLELEKKLAKLEKQKAPQEEEWPKEWDECCFLDLDGSRLKTQYKNDDKIDAYLMRIGNMFHPDTYEQDSEAYIKRLESMSQARKLKFKEAESCWCWDFFHNKPDNISFSNILTAEKVIGAVRKTKEDLLKWYDEFGKYWEL